MSEDLSTLQVLAEVSVGFAGFAALLSAIRVHQAVRALYRAAMVIQIGFSVLIGSLVPLVLAELGLEGTLLWRVTSATTVVLLIRFLSFGMARDRKMTRFGAPPDAPHSLYISIALFWIALGISLTNVIGWPSAPSLCMHTAALLILFAPGVETMVYSFVATLDGAIAAMGETSSRSGLSNMEPSQPAGKS